MIKGIARSGLRGAAHDESEHRRPGVARDQTQIHAVAREGGRETFTVRIRGKSRDESRRRAEAGEADRDVEGRAAQHRVVPIFGRGVRNEVDQSLARNQDHARPPVSSLELR